MKEESDRQKVADSDVLDTMSWYRGKLPQSRLITKTGNVIPSSLEGRGKH